MRVQITNPPGTVIEGRLHRVISERDGAAAQIELEMKVGRDGRARVTFDLSDLMTITRLAKSSTAQRIREAVGAS